ncbi:hypothetical protein KCV00_g392, partial [Aureobasidium melanogenum]
MPSPSVSSFSPNQINSMRDIPWLGSKISLTTVKNHSFLKPPASTPSSSTVINHALTSHTVKSDFRAHGKENLQPNRNNRAVCCRSLSSTPATTQQIRDEATILRNDTARSTILTNCCSGSLLNQWIRLSMPACCPGSLPAGVPDSFCGDASFEEGTASVELLSPEGLRGIGWRLPAVRMEGYKEGLAKMMSRKRMLSGSARGRTGFCNVFINLLSIDGTADVIASDSACPPVTILCKITKKQRLCIELGERVYRTLSESFDYFTWRSFDGALAPPTCSNNRMSYSTKTGLKMTLTRS